MELNIDQKFDPSEEQKSPAFRNLRCNNLNDSLQSIQEFSVIPNVRRGIVSAAGLLSILILALILTPSHCQIHGNLKTVTHLAQKRSPIYNTSPRSTPSLFQRNELLTDDVKNLIQEGYHNTTESLSAAINRLVQKYPDLAESFIIGESVNKNPILGLKICAHKEVDQATHHLQNPAFVILGGIHGDHALGHELSLQLGAFLLQTYSQQPNGKVGGLISSMDVLIIPTLNPDGFQSAREGDCFSARVKSGRKNAAGVDLDQDFRFHNFKDISEIALQNNLQPETKALLKWLESDAKTVKMFATLRTGLTGITYPFDEIADQITEHTYVDAGLSTSQNAAPDKSFFEYVGKEIYFKYQSDPSHSKCNLLSNNITVVDGAQLGSIYGTLNDFLYRYANIFPLNIYLDCCKYPSRDQLESKWLQHGNSLFALLSSINLGVRGSIIDIETQRPINKAKISVTGIDHNVTSSASVGFWRPLAPGMRFNLTVEADGYEQQNLIEISGAESKPATGLVEPIYMDIKLKPISAKSNHDSTFKVSPVNERKSKPLENLPPTSVLKPNILFDHIDEHIEKLDFHTPTELQTHHNFTRMTEVLESLNSKFPEISRLYSIGESVEGRKLWVLEISNRPGEHQLMKPEFRYIGNMHGNEVVGRELILHLAKLLLENYNTNNLVTALVNSTRIHLLPSMNPDGYEVAEEGDCESETGRGNSKKKDLNRNFPDRFGVNKDNNETEPEVQAIMNWSKEYPFVLGANLHGGSLVANYPFDGNKQDLSGQYERSSDDMLFIQLAKTYSYNHPTMSKGEHCFDICGPNKQSLLNERFHDGITNGAQWYVLYGGIQDWVYLNTNCLSITVELGCRKYPFAKDMPRYWSDNKKPLIKYMLEIHRGIYGVVTDQNALPISNATVKVRGIDHETYSVASGDYWRLLLPGEYFVSVSKEGYRAANRMITVSKSGPALRVDFSLSSGPKDLSSDIAYPIISGDGSAAAEKLPSPSEEDPVKIIDLQKSMHNIQHSKMKNNLTIDGSRLLPEYQDSKYMLALCFIIVLPSILLLIYLFGLNDNKRYPNRFGFSRLATSTGDELDEEENDDEGTRFMDEPNKFNRIVHDQNSGSEDELYSVDTWRG